MPRYGNHWLRAKLRNSANCTITMPYTNPGTVSDPMIWIRIRIRTHGLIRTIAPCQPVGPLIVPASA